MQRNKRVRNGAITAPKGFFSSVEQLCGQIRSKGAAPILFTACTYQKGGAKLAAKCWDYDEMAHTLPAAYQKAARENHTLLADVGQWFCALANIQDLYAAHGAHPSVLGSCVAEEAIAAVIRQHKEECL